MATHIGIIDQDPVRLITPLLHRQFKAERVVFIGVDCQRPQFQQLTSVLKARHIETEFYRIPSDINIPLLKQNIQALIERFQAEDTELVFNASVVFDIDYSRLMKFFELITIPFTSSNLSVMSSVGYIRMGNPKSR